MASAILPYRPLGGLYFPNFPLLQTVQCTGQLYRIGIMPQPRGFPIIEAPDVRKSGGHILTGGFGAAVILSQGDDVIACIEEGLRHSAPTLELLHQRAEKVIEDGLKPDECRTVREARCDFPPYISGAKSCYSLCVTMAQGLIQLLNSLDISGCVSLHGCSPVGCPVTPRGLAIVDWISMSDISSDARCGC